LISSKNNIYYNKYYLFQNFKLNKPYLGFLCLLKKNFHTKVSSKLRIGPHNIDIISVIIGSLLGDSYGNSKTIDGVRFAYKQSIVHK
jgi:hypothetical protein